MVVFSRLQTLRKGGVHTPTRARRAVVKQDVIEVALPHELNDKQAWMELDLYLRVWQSPHPESEIEKVGARRPIDCGDH
jgi:hypothetical protein